MTQVEKTDAKLIGTVCIGICATGSSTETKITGECKIIDKKPQWVNDTEILTETMVNTTWERECRSCKDISTIDPGELFKWNCTLKVLPIFLATTQCQIL